MHMSEDDRRGKARLAERKYETKNRKARNARNREWAAANPDKAYTEKRKQQIRDWKTAHPGYQRDHQREKKYGLSKEAFNAILETQNFRCAACGTDLTVLSSKNIHVDHCHVTGHIRGILCHGCNTALGLMRNDTGLILRLASYLDGRK
jgi:hypothetical protein